MLNSACVLVFHYTNKGVSVLVNLYHEFIVFAVNT